MLMWVLVLVYLEIVLIFKQDRCTVAANIPQAQKSFWTCPIEQLGDVGHMEAHFDPFGDSVSIGARYLHVFHRMYHRSKNCFGHTR
jgi:hypothetical protein